MYSSMWPLNWLVVASCHCKTKVLLWVVLFRCHFCAGFAAQLRHGKPGWKPAWQRDKAGRKRFLQCLTKVRREPVEAQGKGEQFTEESHSSAGLDRSKLSHECVLLGGATFSSCLCCTLGTFVSSLMPFLMFLWPLVSWLNSPTSQKKPSSFACWIDSVCNCMNPITLWGKGGVKEEVGGGDGTVLFWWWNHY